MAGAIVLILVMVLVMPVLLFVAGLIATIPLGWSLLREAEEANAGSELIDLNR
jgi:hypothetical protein